jgi:hypothetical protein
MPIYLGGATYSNNTISGASGALALTGNLVQPSPSAYSTTIGVQPAFNANGSGAWIYGSSFGGTGCRELGSPVGWGVSQQGAGSYGFSTSTGRYTAPVAGKYYFHSSTYYLIDSNSTSGYIHYQLAINGNVSWNNGQTPYNIYGHGELANYSDGINVSAIMNLGVGDYASVIPCWGGTIGRLYGSYTLFCGYLIG